MTETVHIATSATENPKSDIIEKILKHFMWCSVCTLILCKGVHRSINRNTCTDVHGIHIYLPTF